MADPIPVVPGPPPTPVLAVAGPWPVVVRFEGLIASGSDDPAPRLFRYALVIEGVSPTDAAPCPPGAWHRR
jgi:hypothetical protein